MLNKIILASKSKVRKEILEKNGIKCDVKPSKIDENPVKESLLKEGASPEIISKNLAELKANKISTKENDKLVLGADSVIDLNGEIISKPATREEALKILSSKQKALREQSEKTPVIDLVDYEDDLFEDELRQIVCFNIEFPIL